MEIKTKSGHVFNGTEVHKVFIECLSKDDTLTMKTVPDNFKVCQSVRGEYIGFDPELVEKKRDIITEYLEMLPDTFRTSDTGGGGGWTFLNGCICGGGQQWGEQTDVDELFILGQALNCVDMQIKDPEIWKMLPGGMPYYVIDLGNPSSITTFTAEQFRKIAVKKVKKLQSDAL